MMEEFAHHDEIHKPSAISTETSIFGPYPSSTGVNWTVTVEYRVLVEILWHRQTYEDREAENELCSEAIEVAELKKAKTSGTCTYGRE